MRGWVSLHLPIEGDGGFWSHSPGQIVAILKSQGLIRRKGTVGDLVQMFGGRKNVRVRDHAKRDP